MQVQTSQTLQSNVRATAGTLPCGCVAPALASTSVCPNNKIGAKNMLLLFLFFEFQDMRLVTVFTGWDCYIVRMSEAFGLAFHVR